MNCGISVRQPVEQQLQICGNGVVIFKTEFRHNMADMHRKPAKCKHGDNCYHHLDNCPDQPVQNRHDENRDCVGDDNSQRPFPL